MINADYWAMFTTEEIKQRVYNRAARMARLMELNAPDVIVANEKLILDEAYEAWVERTGVIPSIER